MSKVGCGLIHKQGRLPRVECNNQQVCGHPELRKKVIGLTEIPRSLVTSDAAIFRTGIALLSYWPIRVLRLGLPHVLSQPRPWNVLLKDSQGQGVNQ